MMTAALLTTHSEWTDRLRQMLGKQVALLEMNPSPASTAAAGAIPIDLLMVEDEYVTENMVAALQQLQTANPNAVTAWVTGEAAADRALRDRDVKADFWVIIPATDLQLRTQVEAILAVARGRVQGASHRAQGQLPLGGAETILTVAADSGHSPRLESPLCRTVGRMSGSFDTDHLLSAYCDAVHEMTQCVSYCLLWQNADAQEYRIVRSEGLPPALHDLCRLVPADPLPSWLQRSRGIVTRDVLAEAPERAPALRELDLCGGVLAIPLLSDGMLRGLMAIGPKAIGAPYHIAEAETLFVLSANLANAARQAELHQELEARNGYIDQVLLTMESGLVTIDLDARICVCNPCAARLLKVDADGLIGRDLRALPSPLGDYLYSCLTHGEERSGEVLTVLGGQANLRLSTRRLSAPHGELMGSMMLLEDVAAEKILAEERRNAVRNEIIQQVVARFAHELKNPLATIHTFAELLPSRSEDPDFQQFWSEHVKRDVHRLDDLVVKLVSLSEQPSSNRQTADISELVDLAVARVAMLDDAAASSITARPTDGLPPLYVDTNVMATALSHLMRYSLGQQRKPVSVHAEVKEGIGGDKVVSIYVRAGDDVDAGVDPARLLDPSYVLDHPDVDLGPSASQRLIESQGGTLEAYHEGGDIVFHITVGAVGGGGRSDDAAAAHGMGVTHTDGRGPQGVG